MPSKLSKSSRTDFSLRFAALLTRCGFASTARRDFLDLLRKREYRRGAYFLRVGDDPRRFAFVVRGAFKLVYIVRGQERIKDFAVAGQYIGGYGASLLNVPIPYDIVALDAAQVLEGDYPSLRERFGDSPAFLRLEKRIVDGLFLQKERRESDLLLLSPADRYLRFLDAFAKHTARIKDHEIAAYIGVTHVTLSRIKARLFRSSGNAAETKKLTIVNDSAADPV